MDENLHSVIPEGEIIGVRFSLASGHEICIAAVSDCGINHATQLSNPFLGLPLQFGKCESCGTSEPGMCEGHFGYIQLPIPIYHPSHVPELKRLLSLLCLKCLKIKQNKVPVKNAGVAERLLSSCCEEASSVSIREVKTREGACYLELKLPSRSHLREAPWSFMDRYGFRYGDGHVRTLLPCEVLEILKKIPLETRKRLAAKGYSPQDGYILQYIPVPPNCLCVPDISDGVNVMSSDLSLTMLKKVLKQIEIIRTSRSGRPNFESYEIEANELQIAVDQYLQIRGTSKQSRDVDTRFGTRKESSMSSTKAWLEKIRTLFISKGSGFSSRTVITGDPHRAINEVGLPREIAEKITFEERVNEHNIKYLQELVDNKLCLTFQDGLSVYSLREGSKGHTVLRPGQVVHRRIMDGDLVFLNRPPTTHKHSLQALRVYVHEDHTVKINPLICGPLGADFDGDAVHLFYPQSLAAKAEALELFSLEKQLLSSHTDNFLLQLATDSMLSLKNLLKSCILDKAAFQQLAMFVSFSSTMPQPSILKSNGSGPCWTALQILQSALPADFDCTGERYIIRKSSIEKFLCNRDDLPSLVNEIVTSIFFEKGPESVLKFFGSLQPVLMEHLFVNGFSVSLKDYTISKDTSLNIEKNLRSITPLLSELKAVYNELLEMQLESLIRDLKKPVTEFIVNPSALGNLIDCKKDSDVNKVVQQVGFLGPQLANKGKFYSEALVEDVASLFCSRYPSGGDDYSYAQYGVVKNCFVHGLDPYEEMVHSISAREVMVRSSRGLSEPGTLFKNLMAILRDVVICYDGTVRNLCSNSVIQFEYGQNRGSRSQSLYPAGEPVGVLAATAMSTPAYKAVLDSSASSNSSWEMMKEILLCKVGFQNNPIDRRVVLYLNDCGCGRNYCHEKAAYTVMTHLKRVSLKDAAVKFTVEYQNQLVGHIHLDQNILENSNISMLEVLQKCQEKISSLRKHKRLANIFRRTVLDVSDSCAFEQSCGNESFGEPCLMFFWQELNDVRLEETLHILADKICPSLLETIIKGDPRILSANITWVSPSTTTWIRKSCEAQRGELALDIVLEKSAVKKSGDAWRVILDSCLPFLHLIDTRRSIPYAIKQVQEMLGILSAFDQAVQRLSSSVSMVTRGILKEHLILLASSMCCAGNLVGFNIGGFKALSRALSVQVPFTEATLYTPKRCFERAAEKCHVDSLSSIVASCSWGKHVTVGTGSRFDILWDTKEIGMNQEGGIGACSFLQMVRSTSTEEEQNTTCLGEEIDDLQDDELAEFWMQSPEQNDAFDKPVFEDRDDYCTERQIVDNCKSDGSIWDSSIEKFGAAEKSGWGSFHTATENVASRADSTDKWTAATRKSNPSPSWGVNNADRTGESFTEELGKWDSEDVGKSKAQATVTSSWGEDRVETQDVGIQKSKTWGRLAQKGINDEPSTEKQGGWGSENVETRGAGADVSSNWGTSTAETWGASSIENQGRSCSWSTWTTKKAEVQTEHSEKPEGWGTLSEPDQLPKWGQHDGEASKKNRSEGSHTWSSKSGEWNSKDRPPSRMRKDYPGGGIYTATRKRLDIFTSEEQDSLLEMEQVMKTIRNIKSKYNDGDQISAEDQSYIVEKVLDHHPHKSVKIGTGVDHIEVGRHITYQDSRCFYIVTADGHREDFSFLKCLQNYIKEKYPDVADSFIEKYFKRNPERNASKETTSENPERNASKETTSEDMN